MAKNKFLFLGFAILMLMAGSLMAQDQMMKKEDGMKFIVNDPGKRDNVTFKSYAPLEDIIGYSNEISGYLVFDPFNPKKGGYGELNVPVSSLDTGIPVRNEHLQSAGWMNAEKHPNITLKINSVKDIKEIKSTNETASYDLTVAGDFTINGMTNKVEFPGRITYLKETDATKTKMPGDLLAARASFSIPLKDYGITGPEGMNLIGSKIGENIEIEVSLMGSTKLEAADK